MSANPQQPNWKSDLLRRLQDPLQMRCIVTALVLMVGYGGIYLPMSAALEEATQRRGVKQKRLEQGRDVQQLQAQFEQFARRLPAGKDPNEWVEYLLGGIRRFPLKLETLQAEAPRTMGPYKVVGLRIALEGTFADLNRFLGWLDENERLLRVESIKMDPDSKKSRLTMQLTVLGLMGGA
jgi:Tfp pilus assembly protein PilO